MWASRPGHRPPMSPGWTPGRFRTQARRARAGCQQIPEWRSNGSIRLPGRRGRGPRSDGATPRVRTPTVLRIVTRRRLHRFQTDSAPWTAASPWRSGPHAELGVGVDNLLNDQAYVRPTEADLRGRPQEPVVSTMTKPGYLHGAERSPSWPTGRSGAGTSTPACSASPSSSSSP
jgi:hypothetical protein